MSECNEKMISKVLESTRRKLLETGTRNRLIHVNRANQRANCLNVINEHSDDIYSILRVQSKRMRFKAMGKDKLADGEEMQLALAAPELLEGSDRLTDNLIETPLGPDALAHRLLRLATDAKTAEEEQGLNILYLAFGFLRWRETPASELMREAPLILLPVQLVRNERTSSYDIHTRDDDITTNLPLQERLRQDFGITLPDVEETDEWSPSDYFIQVSEAVSEQASWSVDVDGMQLGFFSFAKLLMHRDLDPMNWPEGAFINNPLLKGLLIEGFPEGQSLFGPDDKLDDILDPAEIIQVIDADASQTKVIEEVRYGESLVVQGPPGTGKSQTITNIIAAAAHDGQTVLFVAEKMAALSVVHDRLVKAGLRDICLELHSRSANKKSLAQELGRTLATSAKALPAVTDPTQLRKTRDELNRLTRLLHEPLITTGDTPFSTISEIIGFIGKGAPPPCIPLDGLEQLDRKARDQLLGAINAFTAMLDKAGRPEQHPFRGTRALQLQPTDLSRLEDELNVAIFEIDKLLAEASRISCSMHQSLPHTITEIRTFSTLLKLFANVPAGTLLIIPILFKQIGQVRLIDALETGAAWVIAHEAAANKFITAAWTINMVPLRTAIMRGKNSFLARLFGNYRNASSELATLLLGALPKSPSDRLGLIDELIEVQSYRTKLAEDEGWLKEVLDIEWRGERTQFSFLLKLIKWLNELQKIGTFDSAAHIIEILQTSPDPVKIAMSLDAHSDLCLMQIQSVKERLQLDFVKLNISNEIENSQLTELYTAYKQMAEDTSRYNEWVDLSRTINSLYECGAGAIVDAVTNDKINPNQACQHFVYACAEARWEAARKIHPELNILSQTNRHELVQLFSDLEKDRISTTKLLILSHHFEQLPRGTIGEMSVIRGEIGRKKGHKPIRWVMKHAGSMVQRIKPVLLMSPISVAQFLPAGTITFDLLVIDEASQIRPEDALGVIARARQIVVVGDQKQLPPTSFFDRLVDDIEEEDLEDDVTPIGATAADMESILSLCEAKGLRQRMLEWHYRSRDPSLIQVSNTEFYGDRLVLPPSPLQLDQDYGMKFRRVPGIYARGASGVGRQGTNRIEAEEVVKAIADHARNWQDLSLGIVAFSKSQADMLTEVLEHHRRRDTVLDAFLNEGKTEDVFVKNIENVQGDERDVIFISVGYGPQEANGRLNSMTFGPVNSEGGERRLNVLFSRARVRCEIFASFDPADIDPGRVKRDGPRVLKRFLDFAKTGLIDETVSTGLSADSPFEDDVAEVIRSFGYIADPQVGMAGFRIDIGVRHPDHRGQYLVAVECDGAAYHSALWARERDRLRQDILENLGWQFHRIWSTDWFHHRKREIERLKNMLDQARHITEHGIRIQGTNYADARPAPDETITEPDAPDIGQIGLTATAYIKAILPTQSNIEPHEAPRSILADLVSKIVAIEGPIHMDEVARRISMAFGKGRTGNRIVEVTIQAVETALHRDPSLCKDGSFLMSQHQAKNPPIRDRSAETGSVLKSTYLPPIEIKAAAKLILQESGEVPSEDMIRAIARLLGFQRVGADLWAEIEKHLEAYRERNS